MGIWPGWFDLFLDLCRKGDLKPGDAMLDVGASELFCADNPERLNEVLEHFGAPQYPPDELAIMANRAFAAGLFRRAGFRYAAIDYSKFPGVIRRDLNRRGLPWWHRGRYRFVVNSGTSEHILNQWNVFKVIHDACGTGGIMYHGVPGWGDYEHGIIEYSPKFFWALAAANDYEIIRFWGGSNAKSAPLKPDFVRQLEFSHAPMSEPVWLEILLRKKTSSPFRGLNDPAFSSLETVPT